MFVLTLLVGLVMLVVGAELLVRGGGQLALSLRVPALVVGLTIVAFGTSMPELCVSVAAALRASTEMALANVNGSNIANILLVLGAASLVSPLKVDRSLIRREIPVCILLSTMVWITCSNQVVSRGEGFLLLSIGVGYNLWLLWEAMRGRAEPPEDMDDLDGEGPWYRHMALLVVGLGILVTGAYLFVEGATAVARIIGLSDRYIGVTVVALGTSAPEVVTALVSAHRGEADLAVGNSLGSNILNISMVLGITAMITPVHLVDPAGWVDILLALGAAFLLVPIVLYGTLPRWMGACWVVGYVAFVFLARGA